MSRLALGTAQFGMPYGIANQNIKITNLEVKDILQLASINYIDTIDTAISYGSSEDVLGDVGVKSFRVITKLPSLPNRTEDVDKWIAQQISSSFLRLNVNQIYGLLLHNPSDLLGPRRIELIKSLNNLKNSGKIQKIGISIYNPNDLKLFMSYYPFQLVQAPFNLIDQRLRNSGWMTNLKDKGIEIHTRSVFLQGLLLMTEFNRPSQFSPWNHLWHNWRDWLEQTKLSALQACLAFSLSFPEIDRVIVGVDNKTQLLEIITASKMSPVSNFLNVSTEDENLINPVNWLKL